VQEADKFEIGFLHFSAADHVQDLDGYTFADQHLMQMFSCAVCCCVDLVMENTMA